MNVELYSALRSNVSYLGRILGETMRDANGEAFLETVETIRQLSKSARGGNEGDRKRLEQTLLALRQEDLLPVARAFSQFLNLANIAEQHHTVSREMDRENSAVEVLGRAFAALKAGGQDREALKAAVENLSIELVLTAHPTEITRRTLIHKHSEIDACLSLTELQGLTGREREVLDGRIRELVAQIWHTHDFRHNRPTPVDEAKWGFAVVENSLWNAVPEYLRRLDQTLFNATGTHLPVDAAPVRFSSWMGGDRDGNPNVTAEVTREVLLLSRWQAADLYENALDELVEELSMTACNAALRNAAGSAREPYRAVLRQLRGQFRDLRLAIEDCLGGEPAPLREMDIGAAGLWDSLFLCYRSLRESGMEKIADGKLLDLLRRVKCFGIHLVQHDIRQDSERHTDVLSQLTRYLELGDYAGWSEEQRQEFLLAELASRRPLLPADWQPDEQAREVLATFRVIAGQPREALACYIISMARQPSDVLAVELLMKASGVNYHLPVVPLFETLDDLNRAPQVVDRLLNIPGYREQRQGSLMVMIGYSDSAKDAGVMAASWAQYQAQEALLETCRRHDVRLRLFHGRGGTIGRGGAPAHAALLSQPPGSLSQGLRVTEQGEMIRTKLGLTGLAVNTLALYTSAILEANLMEPPRPRPEWRDIMDRLSGISCDSYRGFVRDNPDFVRYFRQATPEQELARLPLGSRPAHRKKDGGISSLRAIPWIFAWMQNRLMLPAWLGAGEALAEVMKSGSVDQLKEMAEDWPFFATRLSMLEMVFAKADIALSEYYDDKLVEPALKPIGDELRTRLQRDIDITLELLDEKELLQHQPWGRESINLRNIYTDPLNVLQVELLDRNRRHEDSDTEQALMVTIAGIAAGMRNTG